MVLLWQQTCPLYSHNLPSFLFHLSQSPLDTYSLAAPDTTRFPNIKSNFNFFIEPEQLETTHGLQSGDGNIGHASDMLLPPSHCLLRCPNTPVRPFKPCPKTPLLPRPPSAPRKGCKQWRSQLKGLCSLSTADMKSGAHEHVPGVLFGALLATLLSLTAACLKSTSIFTTAQVKWYPKLPTEANTKLLNHSSDCRPYSFYPFNSGQKHNHQEHGFRSVQSCSPTEHYGSFYWNSDFCLMHFKYLGLCSKF